MWWAIFFTVAFLVLLFLTGVFVLLGDKYESSLAAYRYVKFAVDQWESLTSTLPAAVCKAAEDRAVRAVRTLNISIYRELGVLFGRAMSEVRNKSLLKLNYTWKFSDDVFTYGIQWRKRNASWAVDWLRPTQMISAVRSIQSLSFDLTTSTIQSTLYPHVPENAVLTGVVWGTLSGTGVYTGILHGQYTLVDKTRLRCVNDTLSTTFSAEHFAILVGNYSTYYIHIYEYVYIEK
ncbi:MAG: hypothetical protein QXI84_10830 [Thermofilaceae archaeon]